MTDSSDMHSGDVAHDMAFAARDGDVAALRSILNSNPFLVDMAHEMGQTCLHFASMWGRIDAVNFLLGVGANVNAENDDGVMPIHFAIRKGHAEVVEALMLGGAKTSGTKIRTLLECAEHLPRGAEVAAMIRSHSGRGDEVTEAIQTRDVDKLRSLLDADALMESEAWAADACGRTPLHYAVLATIAIVDERVASDEDDIFGANDGRTALEMLVEAAAACDAARGRRGEGTVRMACNALDDDGKSPLHHLAQAGCCCHPVALSMLLRAGARPNMQSAPSGSGYASSGQWGKKAADGALKRLREAPDRTPLHMVLEGGDPSATVVQLLLDHKADPNVRDCAQRTALHVALDFGDDRGGIDLDMCALLLTHHADPTLGCHEIGMANSCLHAATAAKEEELVELLLRHGAPHSAEGKGGWTPLAIAARGGAAGIVEKLLAAGADPDASTPCNRKSVRELAVINEKHAVIEVLDRAEVAKRKRATGRKVEVQCSL